ncbi:MAG: helix-turn-helix transcriptional regulator [Clostridia bacterium]
MNNEKTGKLIAKIRQQKNMTQQDIADKFHITNKAVSKWERGLSFPSVDVLENLAKVLEISVVDILAGEIVQPQSIVAQADEVSLQVLKKEQRTKHKLLIVIAIFAVITFLLIISSYSKVIFQRGNPIPYLIASMSISEETPYVEVGKNTGVYITKRGECPPLFDFVEESRNVDFVEQAGSGYIFTNGLDNITVSSEIYWRYFTVWQVPNHTLQAKRAVDGI